MTSSGLTYGDEHVPLEDVDESRAPSQPLWSPATNLFELVVARRSGPDLVVKNLPSQTASRLGEALARALLEPRRG